MEMEAKESKSKPVQLDEREVKAASEGKSEEIMGKSKPVQLDEREVKAASEGKSEEIILEKLKKRKK
jgi:hypothetical protein